MKKILGLLLGAISWTNVLMVCAAEKFEILPDLPEPLAAAQASSISTTTNNNPEPLGLASQSVGQQIDPWTVIISLLIVILSIYAFGIIYTKLNKFGFKLMKHQMGDIDNSRVTVISTTPLGTNKTLHVVELDGKRMLIGASANSIDLIKDLGSYPSIELDDSDYSKIEIPNIRIPKIEIPKIEFPNIGFTKAFKNNKSTDEVHNNKPSQNKKSNISNEDEDGFIISEIYEESSDGIIDKLFTPNKEQAKENNSSGENQNQTEQNAHMIDPDNYALYKKYL